MSAKAKLRCYGISLGLTSIFAALLNYLAMPIWNFKSVGLLGYILCVLTFGTIVSFIVRCFFDEKNFNLPFVFLVSLIILIVWLCASMLS